MCTDAYDQYNYIKYLPYSPVCPHCGKCPHCGQPHDVEPYTPWVNPWIVWPQPNLSPWNGYNIIYTSLPTEPEQLEFEF